MEITLRLSKDFERCLEDLKKKYGEDFEYINGVHPSQLDFSEFIDNFVDKDTLADASIDPNANANHKDIRSFMTEKGKSEDKLFSINKIFLTIKKQWGLRTAKQWLEQEFSKGFYLPNKRSRNHRVSKQERKENCEISRKRIFVEHAIRFIKRFRILSERYRNRRKRFALRFSLIAGICNFDRSA